MSLDTFWVPSSFHNLSCSRSVCLAYGKTVFSYISISLVGLVTGTFQLFTAFQEFCSISSVPLLLYLKTGMVSSFGFLFSKLNKFNCLSSSPLRAFHWTCSVYQCLSREHKNEKYSSICWVVIWGKYQFFTIFLLCSQYRNPVLPAHTCEEGSLLTYIQLSVSQDLVSFSVKRLSTLAVPCQYLSSSGSEVGFAICLYWNSGYFCQAHFFSLLMLFWTAAMHTNHTLTVLYSPQTCSVYLTSGLIICPDTLLLCCLLGNAINKQTPVTLTCQPFTIPVYNWYSKQFT